RDPLRNPDAPGGAGQGPARHGRVGHQPDARQPYPDRGVFHPRTGQFPQGAEGRRRLYDDRLSVLDRRRGGGPMAAAEKPVLSKYKDRMDKAIAVLKDEFASLRTGRASASLLDQVHVDAYGSTVPLTQVAAVSVPEPRMIT